MEDVLAEQIRKVGNEYGTTTGRPRRIGWFDAAIIRYSARISGLTDIALTLLDVLTGLDEIKIAIDYKLDGIIIDSVPSTEILFNSVEPVYITLPGWTEDITKVKSFEELPINAQEYLLKIQETTGVKVSIFSVGPERSQTIELRNVWDSNDK
jgi:adenylosuccinate synthase